MQINRKKITSYVCVTTITSPMTNGIYNNINNKLYSSYFFVLSFFLGGWGGGDVSYRHCKCHIATFPAFTGAGRRQVRLRALFHLQAGIRVEPLSFHKLAAG